MVSTSTPVYRAAQAGLVGTATGVEASAQLNQLLGTHADTVIYQGASIITPSGGTGITQAGVQLSTLDVDQPFAMSGTVIGRVGIPLLSVGNGADLLVSLCSDNGSGAPGTMITQTRIPASWIYQLSAVSSLSVPSTQAPVLQYTNNPLATAMFNTIRLGTESTGTWQAPGPTVPSSGAPAVTSYDTGTGTGYLFIAGGYNSATSALTAQAFTVAFDSAGSIVSSLAQPSLPQAFSGSALTVVPSTENGSTTLTLCLLGGVISGSISSDVYTATFDPSTGLVGAWSAQTSLPVGLTNIPIAAANGYVYVLGGENPSDEGVTTVYYAQISNGQITAWNKTTPAPVFTFGSYATVINNQVWLFTGDETVYYSAINANGTLGPWITGPAVSYALVATGQVTAFSSAGFMNTQAVPFTATSNGPALAFTYEGGADLTTYNDIIGNCFIQAGQWMTVGVNYSNQYAYGPAYLQPSISVPLPATGLTNGSTYHVLMQQQGGDLNNYLWLATDTDVVTTPGGATDYPTLLTSSRDVDAWTAASSGTAVPLQVFDQTVVGQPLHTWVDSGARVSTLVTATTPDLRLLGLCEATRIGLGLNANQGFENGLSPWTVSGGTFAQSATQAYQGTYSAQVTPSGSATQTYIGSEMIPCLPDQWITVSGWMWFTTSVTSDASLPVNWWQSTGAGGGYVSTSFNNVSVGAGTWTQLSNTFQAPATAYQFSINAVLGGTPAASNVFYVDNVYGAYTYTGQQQSTVAEVNWPDVWPSPTMWPPLGTTVLA